MPRIRTLPASTIAKLPALGGYEWNLMDDEIREHWIYFIQGDDGGPIKIGRTLQPKYRLSSIGCGYPFGELGFCAIMRGPRRLELELHRRFAASHMRNEWFAATADLVAFVLSIPEPV